MGQQQSKDGLLYNQVNYANPLVMNDDCQAPLDVARAKGYVDVVWDIEDHICFILRLDARVLWTGISRNFVPPQVVSRKVWVVVLPIGPRNHTKPFKLGLAIYSSCQDAEPQTEIELAPCNENDMQQLHWFSDACKGIPQPPAAPATARPNAEDLELAMAINASIQSAILETSIVDLHSGNGASASADWGSSSSTSEWTMTEASFGTISTEVIEIHNNNISAVPPTSIPSAPPATKEVVEDSPIQYQSISSTPINAFLKL